MNTANWAGDGFEGAGLDLPIEPVPPGNRPEDVTEKIDARRFLRDSAASFLADAGLEANQDAIDQLTEAFLPALRIMCTRAHAGDGSTWKKVGWKPLVLEILKKSGRIHYRDWQGNTADPDSATDLINYAGMYLRARGQGIPAWGEWGEPGKEVNDEGTMHV